MTIGVATQWSQITSTSQTRGERVGSLISSVMTRATAMNSAPSRAGRGRIHASGIIHAAYQGSRIGDIIRPKRIAQPIAPRTSSGVIR